MTHTVFVTFLILLVAIVTPTWTSTTNNTVKVSSLSDSGLEAATTTATSNISHSANSENNRTDIVIADDRKLAAENTSPNSLQIIDKESISNRVQHDPCEAGFPCEDDFWCTSSERCRHCSDLEPWCNNTVLIHDDYTECEQYCYRHETEKTKACEVEKAQREQNISRMETSLAHAESTLQETAQQAAEDMNQCSGEKKQLQHLYQEQCNKTEDYEIQIANLRKKVEDCTKISVQKQKDRDQQCDNATNEAEEKSKAADKKAREADERADELKTQSIGYLAGLGVMTALWLGTMGAWILCKYCNCPQTGKRPKHNALLGHESTHRKAKKPVQANRHSTHFSSSNHPTDNYCLAGTGGYAHLADDNTATA